MSAALYNSTATPNQKTFQRKRSRYAVAAAVVIGVGLFWRSGFVSLSSFTAKYGGDALWALVVFLGFGFLFRCVSTLRIALVSVCFAWSLEFLQLYHAPWIDSLRASQLGHLILGSTFNGPDFLAYAFGIAIGAFAEKLFTRKSDELDTLLQNKSQTKQEVATAKTPWTAASSRKRIQSTAWMVLAFLIALFSIIAGAWNSFKDSRAESSLRAPGFSDVSAFGEAEIARVDAWLQEQMALGQYPSLNVAIIRDGKIVYQGAFGFEDIQAGRKATPQTSYHVASVTKAFTASLVVMLHARGVVDLDQPVAKYLPKDVSISAKPALGATITLRQLASHTSGLPRGIPGRVQSVEGRYQLEPKRLYDHLAGVKLEFDPGTGQIYSNLGFGLLGHALERAAGKPFDQLLQDMLCEPLRLAGTAIEVHDKLRLATGYGSTNPRREVKHSYRERLAFSGGLITSASDLAKFLAAQMKPGIFTSEMLAQLHTPSKLSDGRIAGTGLGWSIGSSQTLGRIVEKNGGRNNCSAWIGFAPEHGVGVAVVTNCGGPDVDSIGEWLLERSIPGGYKPVTN
jgi:CubicO group peptidase (beta-lactamase class C family)